MNEEKTSFEKLLSGIADIGTAGLTGYAAIRAANNPQAPQPAVPAAPARSVPMWVWLVGGGVVVVILGAILIRK